MKTQNRRCSPVYSACSQAATLTCSPRSSSESAIESTVLRAIRRSRAIRRQSRQRGRAVAEALVVLYFLSGARGRHFGWEW
eukprot:5921490-Pleurochrysis_carterae.AAC.1